MFGFGKKRPYARDIVGELRPEVSRAALGVGLEFPGIVMNPQLSLAARKRNKELRAGELAIGTVVDWREVSNDGKPRVVLMLDVETPDGIAFRGVADESLTVTELTRLAPGDQLAVRYRPANMDHYVALARDADPAAVRELIDRIGPSEPA